MTQMYLIVFVIGISIFFIMLRSYKIVQKGTVPNCIILL